MNVTKIAGTATIVGALGAAALGLSAGTAQADDWAPSVRRVPHVHDGVVGNPLTRRGGHPCIEGLSMRASAPVGPSTG